MSEEPDKSPPLVMLLTERRTETVDDRESDTWIFQLIPVEPDVLAVELGPNAGKDFHLSYTLIGGSVAGVLRASLGDPAKHGSMRGVNVWGLSALTLDLYRQLRVALRGRPPAGLRLVPPAIPQGDQLAASERIGERPAEFAPTAITITSDPYTQASIRSMWAPQEWTRPANGGAYYTDANGVMVYTRDAGDVVLGLDDNKVSAFVICLGKWFAETGGDLSGVEAARVHVNDLLAFRGIRKHPSGGYQPKQKEAAKEDILFLRDLWVRSRQQVWESTRRGKRQQVDVEVDDPLVEVSVENTVDLWGERTPYAFRFRPGPWARHYLGGPQHWTTAVLKQIMAYHPYSDRLKMRLGLYLTFQWRIRANRGTLEQPWKLKTLLEGAKIEIPKKDPQRFYPRVLAALEELRSDGVLAVCEALDSPGWTVPGDAPPKQWVPQLLEGRWRLLPVDEVRSRLPKPAPREKR